MHEPFWQALEAYGGLSGAAIRRWAYQGMVSLSCLR